MNRNTSAIDLVNEFFSIPLTSESKPISSSSISDYNISHLRTSNFLPASSYKSNNIHFTPFNNKNNDTNNHNQNQNHSANQNQNLQQSIKKNNYDYLNFSFNDSLISNKKEYNNNINNIPNENRQINLDNNNLNQFQQNHMQQNQVQQNQLPQNQVPQNQVQQNQIQTQIQNPANPHQISSNPQNLSSLYHTLQTPYKNNWNSSIQSTPINNTDYQQQDLFKPTNVSYTLPVAPNFNVPEVPPTASINHGALSIKSNIITPDFTSSTLPQDVIIMSQLQERIFELEQA